MKNLQTKRILGIDPGIASSGWGIIEVGGGGGGEKYLAHGCIETDSGTDHSERVLAIYKVIKRVIKKYEPAGGAIESLFFSRNVKSAMPVAEARGVLCMAMAEAGLSVYEYTPNQIKQTITGVVNASKEQVQEMVKLLLHLDEIPSPNHAADALGAAICCAHNNDVN
jgi:crossover junction endodeoxyribonuclease RuvC